MFFSSSELNQLINTLFCFGSSTHKVHFGSLLIILFQCLFSFFLVDSRLFFCLFGSSSQSFRLHAHFYDIILHRRFFSWYMLLLSHRICVLNKIIQVIQCYIQVELNQNRQMNIKQQHDEGKDRSYVIKTIRDQQAILQQQQNSHDDNSDSDSYTPSQHNSSVKQQPNDYRLVQSQTPDHILKKQMPIGNKKIMKRPRKIRTTITKEKLIQMNLIFSQYMQNKERGSIPSNNLKQIGKQLKLGYSTILHKYRQFRAFRKVKGGALISSLQKRRKYKKSLMIQQILQQTLNERPFYTAVELSQYIYQKYGLQFSRSIISRHLGEMGYSYKNLRLPPEQKTQIKYKQIRKIYSQILIPLLQRNQKLIYIDQLTCSVRKNQQQRYVSVVVILTIYGIIFYNLQEGFFTRSAFMLMLKQFLKNLRESQNCRNLEGQKQELYLIMDMNRIHRDNQANFPGIANLMLESNAELLYIPPCSPQLNPLQNIFARLKQKLNASTIETFDDLWNKLQIALEELKQEPTEQYFKEVDKWLLKCHNQQAF